MKKSLSFLFLSFFSTCIFNTYAQEDPPLEKEAIQNQNKRFKQIESWIQVLYQLETLYVDPEKVKPEKMDEIMEKGLESILNQFDPHTRYLFAKQYQEFSQNTKGEFEGLGVVISQENQDLEIKEIFPSSPAERAGIVPGDKIIQIDDFKVEKDNLEIALQKIRGSSGSEISLTLQNQEKIRKVKIKREIIKNISVTSLDLGKGDLYVKINSFQGNITNDIENIILKHQKEKKLKGLIIDLRGNPGGLLSEGIRAADLFISHGIIVQIQKNNPQENEIEWATSKQIVKGIPIIVLIDENSASSSEIFAGAMQSNKIALIMGRRSFGKGSIQSIIPLPNGGAAKITVARYLTPDNMSIQNIGINPDIVIFKPQETKEPQGEVALKGHLENIQEKNKSTLPQEIKNDFELIQAYSLLQKSELFSKPTKEDSHE